MVTRKRSIVEGTYTLKDCCQLLLWSFSETNADDLDELLPTDVVSEVADSLDQFISRVHVKSFESDLESLAVDALLSDGFSCLSIWISHDSYFLKGFVEIIEIVDLETVQTVLLYQIRQVLSAK